MSTTANIFLISFRIHSIEKFPTNVLDYKKGLRLICVIFFRTNNVAWFEARAYQRLCQPVTAITKFSLTILVSTLGTKVNPNMKTAVFGDVTLLHPSFTIKMETGSTSETLANIYQTKRNHAPGVSLRR
jgi:hypothetical protein